MVWCVASLCAQPSKCVEALPPFDSTGHYFRAELFEGETARLRLTLSSDHVYRFVVCSETGKPVLNLYDRSGVLALSTKQTGKNYFDCHIRRRGKYTLTVTFERGEGMVAVVVGEAEKDAADQKGIIAESI
ncbi:MAG: hypothetical protein NZ534_05230 [Bacteroidia bacterium]|nr:hypothetical protein [Bacteroidia bacterium]